MRKGLFFKVWLAAVIVIGVAAVAQVVAISYAAIVYGPRALEAGVSLIENAEENTRK